jgi:hypothetical protein
MKVEKGERVRITALGPQDSYFLDGNDFYKVIGRTGYLHEIYSLPITTPGYVACRIKLDEPLLNYIVIITLVDCKVERLDNGQDKV